MHSRPTWVSSRRRGADLEVRSFAPGDGIPEDPVCGRGNGCVAALVRRDGVLKTRAYVAIIEVDGDQAVTS